MLLVGPRARPALRAPAGSKGYLRGEIEREDDLPAPGRVVGASTAIELLTRTSVMKLDTGGAGRRSSPRKEEVAYGAGACWPRAPTCGGCGVPGAELEGIHYLRALGNADAIRADADDAEHVVLIGGSYIACEVAASLTALGKRCTLVMQEARRCARGFGEHGGRVLRRRCCAERGVELVTRRRRSARFEGEGPRGRGS